MVGDGLHEPSGGAGCTCDAYLFTVVGPLALYFFDLGQKIGFGLYVATVLVEVVTVGTVFATDKE